MFWRSLLCKRSCTTAVTIKARLFCFSAYTSQKLGHICSEKERDRYPERQTANRAKSSKGYSARKTDPVGERERERVARFIQERKTSKQGRHERAYLVWKWTWPSSSATPLQTESNQPQRDSHTWKDTLLWWALANWPLLSIIPIIIDFNSQQFTFFYIFFFITLSVLLWHVTWHNI